MEITEGKNKLIVKLGHASGISSLVFSPDELTLASADSYSIKLWDVESGFELRTISENLSTKHLCFSPDGKFLVSDNYNVINLWNLAEGQNLTTLSNYHELGFCSDGKILACGVSNKIILIRDLITGEVKSLPGHIFGISAITFSSDGRRLASGSRDKTVKIWDTLNGQELKTLSGHTAIVDLVKFSPDNRFLASVCKDGNIILWDTATGNELKRFKNYVYRNSVEFSPDGRILAVRMNNIITLFSVITGEEIGNFDNSKINDPFAFSPDWQILAARADDGIIKLRDTATGQEIRTLNHQAASVRAIAFMPGGKLLASGGSDKSVRFWDPKTGQNLKTLKGHSSAGLAVAFSPDGKYLASGMGDNTVKLWNLTAKSPLKTLVGHTSEIKAVAFSPDTEFLASLSNSGEIIFWNPATGQNVGRLNCPTFYENLGFSRDGKLLASGNKKHWTIWDRSGGKKLELEKRQDILTDFPTYFEPCDEAVSDSFSARIIRDGRIHLFDWSTKKEAASLFMIDDHDWLVITPEGFFDGTPQSWAHLSWQIDSNPRNFKTAAAGFEKFYYSGLVPDIFSGKFPAQKSIGRAQIEKDLIAQIVEIDTLISLQLNEIIHHEDFQRLEAAWRGLHYLVYEAQPNRYLRIKVFQVSKKDALKDFERALEFDQSNIFKKIYDDIYGNYRENPFGLLIGNYEFGNHPQDLALLEKFSQVAAVAHAPFISGASPLMFGWDSFSEMNETRDISAIFNRTEFMKWRSLRESEDSLYVGLSMPHILLRESYQSGSSELFDFHETTGAETFLWGNAAYAFGACVAKAYRESSWLGMMRGPESDGLAEGLCTYENNGFEQSVEVLIDAAREAELSNLGFIPLMQNLSGQLPAFFSDRSCHKVRKYDMPAANKQADLSRQLPFVFAMARFAHYLKVISRNRSASFTDAMKCAGELNLWIRRYYPQFNHSEMNDELNARYPLKEYMINVVESNDKRNRFNAITFLRPGYQLEDLPIALRAVVALPDSPEIINHAESNFLKFA